MEAKEAKAAREVKEAKEAKSRKIPLEGSYGALRAMANTLAKAVAKAPGPWPRLRTRP